MADHPARPPLTATYVYIAVNAAVIANVAGSNAYSNGRLIA